MNRRLILLFFVFGIFWIVLLVRIFNISIVSHEYYEKQAFNNTIREEPVIPIRGQILDRFGEPLATNVVDFTITLPPKLSIGENRKILNDEIDKILKFFPKYTKDDLIKSYMKQDTAYNHEYIPKIGRAHV